LIDIRALLTVRNCQLLQIEDEEQNPVERASTIEPQRLLTAGSRHDKNQQTLSRNRPERRCVVYAMYPAFGLKLKRKRTCFENYSENIVWIEGRAFACLKKQTD